MIGFDYWKIQISYPRSWAIKAMDRNVKGKNIYGGLIEELRCSGVCFLNWIEFDCRKIWNSFILVLIWFEIWIFQIIDGIRFACGFNRLN